MSSPRSDGQWRLNVVLAAFAMVVASMSWSPTAAHADTRYPVLLAHGGLGKPQDFDLMVKRLEKDGYRAYTVKFPGFGVDTATNARLIARKVAEIKAAAGASKVHLVGHSMGGVSARYYIKNLNGLADVATYTAFGTPQHGVKKKGEGPLSDPCSPGAFIPDQCPTGPILTALNADDDTPGEIHYTSIASTKAPDEADGSWHPLDQGACLPLVAGGDHGAEPRNEIIYAAVKDGLNARCPSGLTNLPDITP